MENYRGAWAKYNTDVEAFKALDRRTPIEQVLAASAKRKASNAELLLAEKLAFGHE